MLSQPSPASPPAYAYRPLLDLLAAQVQASLERQVLDPARAEDGCFLDPGTGFPNADHVSHSRDLAALCQAFLAEGSPLAGEAQLGGRIARGAAFLRRWQRPSGLIDLPTVDFESPPDTAFAVQLLAPILRYARRRAAAGWAPAAEVAGLLAPFVASGGEALIGRGFRTPNHRWVVCSALALAMREEPALRARGLPYLETILAEGIDINADGEFSERSTGIYNAVNDRALRYLADALERPGLLDHVRANLRFIGALLEGDGTVITAISGRQDRGGRTVPVTMADSFFDLACRDRDGELAWLADLLVERARGRGEKHGWGWMVQAFLDRPELIAAAPLPRRAPPQRLERTWTASRLWFVKEGPLAAFASAGTAIPFALRVGDVELRSLRGATTFLHAPPLGGDEFAPIPGGVRLSRRPYEHGWDLPLGRPVRFGDCGEYYRIAERERQHWMHGRMALSLEVQRQGADVVLRIATAAGDCERVPAQLELSFASGGAWRTAGGVQRAEVGGCVQLQQGQGIYQRGGHALRVALEAPARADAHAWWELGHLPGDHDGFRVLLNLQTPLAVVLRLTPGRWTPADPYAVQPL